MSETLIAFYSILKLSKDILVDIKFYISDLTKKLIKSYNYMELYL